MNRYNKCLIIVLLLISNVLNAQNFKYNTEQYGIKGSLLGGAIVAGADDMSMVYYNPAAIHSITSGIDISLIRPRINSFGFKQFWNLEEQSKLNTTISLNPLQISFKTKYKGLDLAFIKINKTILNDQFSALQESVNANIEQKRFFEYKYEGSDSWYGFGTSFKLKPNLYIGITQFVSFSKYSYQNEILTEIKDLNINPNESIQHFNSYTNNNYNNTGLISKIGLIYNTAKHDFGLTITTPSYLYFLKSGNSSQSKIDLRPSSSIINRTIDLELSPKIKNPWEFSLGYSFLLNEKRKLWLNFNYYTKVNEYVITKIESVNKILELTSGNESIFNYGIGYSDQLSNKVELSGGVRINNYAYQNKSAAEGSIRNVILDGNTLHISLGTKLKYKKQIFLLSFDWGTLVSVPYKENFDLIKNISQLHANTSELTKNSINILLTYRFILDRLTKQKRNTTKNNAN